MDDGNCEFEVECRLPRYADLAAGGLQGSRHRLQQLIPDGLSPSEHLRSALNTRNPYVDGAVFTTVVTQALGVRQFSAEQLL